MKSLAVEIKELAILSHAEGMRDGADAVLTTLLDLQAKAGLTPDEKVGYDLAVGIVRGAKEAAIKNFDTVSADV